MVLRGPLRSLVVLAFANGVADAALFPLLPEIRRDLDLTALQTGAVLSATTFAMLATAIPIGLLVARVGARKLLLASSLLMPVSLAGQAAAAGLPFLLVSRVAFGVSFGILWVVGPARAAAGGRGAAGTGRLIAASGAGWLVGPVAAGVLADAAGWRAAYAALAAVSLGAVLLVASGRDEDGPVAIVRLRHAFATARHDRSAGGATLVSALLGVITGVSGLLAPLVLSANGLSPSAIGLVVAAAAIVWIAAAALVGRLRAASVDLRAIGIAVVVLSAVWLVPALSLSTAAVAAFLVVSAGCRSSVNTLVYAVGARAAGGDAGAAAVIGVMNLAWAAAALVAPIAAGAVEGDGGTRLAFACTALIALAVGAVLLAPRRSPVPA